MFDVLRERDIALCITEQPEFASPVVATATWGYARLHKLDYDEAGLVVMGREDQGAELEGGVRLLQARRGEGSGPAGGEHVHAGVRAS